VLRCAGERRSVHVPDAIGVQKRESGVLIEMTKHLLESGPIRQAGVRRLKAHALVWRGEE
jgi:hypothetical protein